MVWLYCVQLKPLKAIIIVAVCRVMIHLHIHHPAIGMKLHHQPISHHQAIMVGCHSMKRLVAQHPILCIRVIIHHHILVLEDVSRWVPYFLGDT